MCRDQGIFSFKKTFEETVDNSCIQRAADFIKAFTLGFEVDVFLNFKLGCTCPFKNG